MAENIQKIPLIWIDLEMTGLYPQTDRIIEIATIVTDGDLNILAEGPVIAISQSQEMLIGMDDWNQKHHRNSGLVDRVKQSEFNEKMAEEKTIEFLKQYVAAGKSPMCGNSICQDRRFLANYMPDLEKFFHYRQIDVSTIKELAKRWVPELAKQFKKESKHIALEDIKDSIEEMKFYKDNWLKSVG